MFAGNSLSYIEFPNNGALDVQHSITMLCWVYYTGADGPLFSYNKGNTAWGVHLQIASRQLFVRYTHRNYQFTPHLYGGSLPLNQWSYVVSTYDYNTGTVRLWIDRRQTAQSSIGRVRLSIQDVVRMDAQDGDIRRFRGRIAAMQLCNVALTEEQINSVKKVGLANYSKLFSQPAIIGFSITFTTIQINFYNYLLIHFFVADAFDKLKSCQNGAACVPSGDGYTCACGVGFQGTNCEHGQ